MKETERYHAYLRNVFESARLEHADLTAESLLQLAINASNDIAEPAGMVPALLVFEIVPRMPVHANELPKQQERMMALQHLGTHMAKLTNEIRLEKAVNSSVTAGTDADMKIDDQMLVYRNEPISSGGLFCLVGVNNKVLHIDNDGRLVQHSIDR